jgi:hypothetical protein
MKIFSRAAGFSRSLSHFAFSRYSIFSISKSNECSGLWIAREPIGLEVCGIWWRGEFVSMNGETDEV